MLQNYLESDFKLNKLDKSRYGVEKKAKKENSPFLKFFSFFSFFFFKFANVTNIDLFNVQRFMLVFWLFTGSYGSIDKYKVNLRLGINYYHFFIKYKIKKRKFFFIISFLLEDFLNQQYWSSSSFFCGNFILFFKNLEILTNYKLARGVYFYRIQQKFFFTVSYDSSLYHIFNVVLNSLKLNVEQV